MSQRMATGVPGLDDVLNDGLLAGRSYLLVGQAGAGKTILSLQWLRDGSASGQRCMLITLAEPPDVMVNNVASFGWDLDGIEVVDLTLQGPGSHDDYSVFVPSDVESEPVYREVYKAIERFRPERLVIDSLSQLRYLSPDAYQFRKQLLRLLSTLSRLGCTTFLADEPQELSVDVSAALAVDGILHLRREQSSHRSTEVRSVQMEKFRGSDFRPGRHHFRFTPDGIQVFPNLLVTRRANTHIPGQLGSGVKALDKMLGGGLEYATTTLISGPTGVGKSTLAAKLVSQAIAEGGKGVYLSFEEDPSSILARNDGIGIFLGPLVDSGQLILEYIHPRQLFPDELFHKLDKRIDEGHKFVVIDGLRGYESAMNVYGQAIIDLQNLISLLLSKGVSVILTHEVEVIAGELRATEVGASHLADNLVLLRYAEYAGEIIKLIGCLKKRRGPFESELREFRIRPNPIGIRVGPKLQFLRGLLTGAPTFEPERHKDAAIERGWEAD